MEEDKIYCSKCDDYMTQGYTVHDGLDHYCSDKCLYKDISKEEYLYMYEQGYAFWTTFED